MDISVITVYTLIGIAFIFALLAYTSPSQSQRQRFLVGHILSMLLGALVAFVLILLDYNFSSLLGVHYLAFGLMWPQLIGRLIVQQRVGPSLVTLKYNTPNLVLGIVSIAFLIGLTSLFMIPNSRRAIDGRPIFDEAYIRSRVSFLLMTIPLVVLSFMTAIQRTIVYSGGILHDGLPWAWSDFRSFTWIDHPKESSLFELFVGTKNTWFIKHIKLKMSLVDKQKVESLLAQKIISKG